MLQQSVLSSALRPYYHWPAHAFITSMETIEKNSFTHTKQHVVKQLPMALQTSLTQWVGADVDVGDQAVIELEPAIEGVQLRHLVIRIPVSDQAEASPAKADNHAFILKHQDVDWVFKNEVMLSLQQVMEITHCKNRQSVHAAEKRNAFFGLLPPARTRGTQYPKWQFETGIAGKPLSSVLQIIHAQSSLEKWLFFTSRNDLLADLSPLSVLRGKPSNRHRELSEAQRKLYACPPEARLDKVLEAAKGNRIDY
jgi:hypothetical protein